MSYLSQFEVQSFVKEIVTRTPYQANKYVKISVITASYNQAKFLERTILSVINQGYPNVEFIVIDGGSTDDSVDILKKYNEHIAYWSSAPDNGQANAINKGLKLATGELLCFQNSDDLFYKDAFHTLNNYYQKNSGFDGYFGDLLIIDNQDLILEAIKTIEFDLNNQILNGMQIFNQSFFFTKKLAEKFGYIDEGLNFVIDYENVARWASNGAIFKKIDGLIGAFRVHNDAKTSNIDHIRVTELNDVMEKYYDKIDKTFYPIFFLKQIIKLKKVLYFLKKGDLGYVFYRFLRNS